MEKGIKTGGDALIIDYTDLYDKGWLLSIDENTHCIVVMNVVDEEKVNKFLEQTHNVRPAFTWRTKTITLPKKTILIHKK